MRLEIHQNTHIPLIIISPQPFHFLSSIITRIPSHNKKESFLLLLHSCLLVVSFAGRSHEKGSPARSLHYSNPTSAWSRWWWCEDQPARHSSFIVMLPYRGLVGFHLACRFKKVHMFLDIYYTCIFYVAHIL